MIDHNRNPVLIGEGLHHRAKRRVVEGRFAALSQRSENPTLGFVAARKIDRTVSFYASGAESLPNLGRWISNRWFIHKRNQGLFRKIQRIDKRSVALIDNVHDQSIVGKRTRFVVDHLVDYRVMCQFVDLRSDLVIGSRIKLLLDERIESLYKLLNGRFTAIAICQEAS